MSAHSIPAQRRNIFHLLSNLPFLSVSMTHTMADTLTSNVPLILAYVSAQFGLGNATIGMVASLYHIVLALGQPLFGWLADRQGSRWFAGGGLLWQAALFLVAMALIMVSPWGWLALPVLIIASLGSGAFHPAGTERATVQGLALMGTAATASSIFFLFGQMGLGLGPWVGGVLLQNVGLWGIAGLAVISLPIGLLAVFALRNRTVVVRTNPDRPVPARAPLASPIRPGWVFLALFALMITMRMAPQSIMMTFIPKLLLDRGFESSYQGAAVAALMVGSAIGGVIGGVAADRFGRRNTIMVAMLLSALPLYLLPVTTGPLLFVVAAIAGAATGAPHSVIVVLSQSLMPCNMAMASGLALGFMFATGALVSWGIGVLAETYPLALMMQLSGGFALLGVLLCLALKGDQPVAAAQPAAAD